MPYVGVKFASRYYGCILEAERFLGKTVDGSDRNWCLAMKLYLAEKFAPSAGLGADDMDRDMLLNIATSRHSLRRFVGKSRKVGLVKWLRQSLTATTTIHSMCLTTSLRLLG